MTRRLALTSVLAVAVLAAIGVGIHLLGPRAPHTAPTALQPTAGGALNILIIGKDARALGPVVNEGRQRNRREEQSHSDIIIVCHVNLGAPAVNLLAIPRDLLVEAPGITAAASNTDFTNMEKIAHAYAIGGDRLLRRTVTRLLGIPIHRSIAFDFDTFRMVFDLLRPLVGRLRVGEVELTEREQALKFARKRQGLKHGDADRCRNALQLVRGIVTRTWWLTGTRLSDIVIRRLLAIVGPDTDLTREEVHQLSEGLRRAGFSPTHILTAVLVSEGADVTLTRYRQTLSCYLPVYPEIERQINRFLLDRTDVQALDFMTPETYRAPNYLYANYVVPTDTTDTTGLLPFDTTGMDSQVKATRLKELARPSKKKPVSGPAANSVGAPADSLGPH